MPVRKIPLRYTSLSGIKPSQKTNRSISYESSLERDFICILEADNRVEYYEEQPYKIEYLDPNKKLRSYVPDFLVCFKEPLGKNIPKEIIYEVKYTSDLAKQKRELQMKFAAAEQFCKKEGYAFKIITEKEIRTPYLENLQFLKRYAKKPFNIPMYNYLEEKIKKLKITTPQELIETMSEVEETRAIFLYTLWIMVANGAVSVNLTKKITMNSKIWQPY